jgi:hypothetical protein
MFRTVKEAVRWYLSQGQRMTGQPQVSSSLQDADLLTFAGTGRKKVLSNH